MSTAELKAFLHGQHLASAVCLYTSSGGKHRGEPVLGLPFIVNLVGMTGTFVGERLGIRTHWSAQNRHMTNCATAA